MKAGFVFGVFRQKGRLVCGKPVVDVNCGGEAISQQAAGE